jgi:tRNA(Ile)-lysidine synthase
MARYVVAVSGGIDSVVLLHMLRRIGRHELIVAHVDHGIRDDSADDERFVRGLAALYHLPYVTTKVHLGPEASEERARDVRYAFLRQQAAEHDAEIMTAHHGDDVIETIAINLHRGTGWRGAATHDAAITRPLLGYTKQQLRDYAQQHQLEWQEDSTNVSDRYLRNRIRKHVASLDDDTKAQVLSLRDKQRALKRFIEAEAQLLIGEGPEYSRYFLTHIPMASALECLRQVTNGALTRPQLERALLAIKTAQAGSIFEAGNHLRLLFTTRHFSVSLVQ